MALHPFWLRNFCSTLFDYVLLHGFEFVSGLISFTWYMNSSAGKVGPGFGIGALEELDDEDEDVYASG